jgi:hypothetical protein
MKSSVLPDVAHQLGRHPELFALSTALMREGLVTGVQAFARAAGIATPHLDAITALVIETARRIGLYPPAAWPQ